MLLLYGGIQMAEGYVIYPLIQERAASLPPALVLGAQILLGVLVGFIGLLVATPLLVCLMVLIQMLYVEDTLGDPMPALGSDE